MVLSIEKLKNFNISFFIKIQIADYANDFYIKFNIKNLTHFIFYLISSGLQK